MGIKNNWCILNKINMDANHEAVQSASFFLNPMQEED